MMSYLHTLSMHAHITHKTAGNTRKFGEKEHGGEDLERVL